MKNSQFNQSQGNLFLKNQSTIGQNPMVNKSQVPTVNSVFQNTSLMNSGINLKTQNIIINSLVGGNSPSNQQRNQQGGSSPLNYNQQQSKLKTQISFYRMESRNELDSQQSADGQDQNFNKNSRLYRNLSDKAAIKKYTDRNKIQQINDDEIIYKKINDEQGISTKEYTMKLQEYKFKKDKFEDSGFSYKNQLAGFKGSQSTLQWMRLHKLFEGQNLFPQQPYSYAEELNTDYPEFDNLFQVYNILSRAKHLAQRLFEAQTVNSQGIYSIWIFKNGKWKSIILDDYVLVQTDSNLPSLYYPSQQAIKQNLWLLILEKALAKTYKGYQNIKISEVYNALVDLTGSPYLLIKKRANQPLKKPNKEEQYEKEEKNFLWQKISNSTKKSYIISAQCLETHRGLQKNNVYFIEFVHEFQQEYGESAKIIQMRNCRINQRIQDVQFNNLKQEEVQSFMKYYEEGVFFMNFEDFYKKFDYFAISRIETRDQHNSIKLQQENNKDIGFFTVRLKNFEQTSGYISLCQKDIQFFRNQGYAYSQFIVVLAEVKSTGDIIFYSQTHSNEKMIHIPYNWGEGIFLIHIEARWSQKIYQKFKICVSSNQDVGLQQYNYAQQRLNGELILSLIARNYLEKQGIDIKDINIPKAKRGQLGTFFIYHFKNTSSDFCTVKAQIDNKENQEFLDTSIVEKNKISFWLFPNEEFIINLRIVTLQQKNQIKFTFQKSLTSVPQNEPPYPKTMQYQLKGINIYEQFSSLSDRKQNLLIDYFQQPVTLEDSEQSEQIQVEEQQKIITIKKEYPFDYSSPFYRYTRLSTAVINYLIVFLVMFSSIFRCLEYDVFVYTMIFIKMNNQKIQDKDLKLFIILCSFTVVYDAIYIQLFSFKAISSFSEILEHSSTYQAVLGFNKVMWILLVSLKVIYQMCQKDNKLFFNQFISLFSYS